MYPEIKTKWLEALRSGNYKQGQNYLHKANEGEEPKFCCLGVLCDIASKQGIGKWTSFQGTSHIQAFSTSEQSDKLSTYPPYGVTVWAGLSAADPMVEGNSLATYNDGLGYDFSMIADLIEKNL